MTNKLFTSIKTNVKMNGVPISYTAGRSACTSGTKRYIGELHEELRKRLNLPSRQFIALRNVLIKLGVHKPAAAAAAAAAHAESAR